MSLLLALVGCVQLSDCEQNGYDAGYETFCYGDTGEGLARGQIDLAACGAAWDAGYEAARQACLKAEDDDKD